MIDFEIRKPEITKKYPRPEIRRAADCCPNGKE